MYIDDKVLSKLEKLSALKIDKSKRRDVINELSKIVEFVEILSELDLSNEKATFTTLKGGTPFRQDIPRSNIEVINTILEHAPRAENRYFLVPKIIEG